MDGSEQQSFARALSSQPIAELNDRLRRTGLGGQIVVTAGVNALAGFNPAELIEALARFNSFDQGDDPYGERDFGDMDLWGAELLWKIDYYDHDLTQSSADPADGSLTARVLTVMLADEY